MESGRQLHKTGWLFAGRLVSVKCPPSGKQASTHWFTNWDAGTWLLVGRQVGQGRGGCREAWLLKKVTLLCQGPGDCRDSQWEGA